MAPRVFSIAAALVTSMAAISGAAAFKDPHNKFCGNEECYSVLGLTRGADKAEIKKAYRAISLDVHPDKNPSPAAKEKFTVRAALSFIPCRSVPRLFHYSQTLPTLRVHLLVMLELSSQIGYSYAVGHDIASVCVVLAQRDVQTRTMHVIDFCKLDLRLVYYHDRMVLRCGDCVLSINEATETMPCNNMKRFRTKLYTSG